MSIATVLNRRVFVKAAAGALLVGRALRAKEKRMEKLWVFVGTSTQNGKSKGIYRFQ